MNSTIDWSPLPEEVASRLELYEIADGVKFETLDLEDSFWRLFRFSYWSNALGQPVFFGVSEGALDLHCFTFEEGVDLMIAKILTHELKSYNPSIHNREKEG